MVTYARDEIIPATDFARNFSAIFKSLATGIKEKIAVAKNNKLEMIMLPIAEYERMKEAQDLLEHIEIYNIVNERKNQPTVSFNEVLKKAGLTEDDLRD
jgi:PHD/YefM family antitoxin component YafN of YafNO toxin-antitoxin module